MFSEVFRLLLLASHPSPTHEARMWDRHSGSTFYPSSVIPIPISAPKQSHGTARGIAFEKAANPPATPTLLDMPLDQESRTENNLTAEHCRNRARVCEINMYVSLVTQVRVWTLSIRNLHA